MVGKEGSLGLRVGLVAGIVLAGFASSDAQTCASDNFNAYANGGLGGQGSWTGSTAGAVDVVAGEVRVTGGQLANISAILPVACEPLADGTITVIIYAKGGSSSGSNIYRIFYEDPTGKELASWYGSGATAVGRIAGTTTSSKILSTSSYTELKVIINVNTDMVQFYAAGALKGTLSHSVTGAGDTIGQVRIEAWANGLATDNMWVDDLSITGRQPPPPPTCTAQVTPGTVTSAAPEGAAASPASHTFTILNNNTDPFSYTVTETDLSGAPTDHTWLDVPAEDETGGPLASSESDTAAALLDPVTAGLTAGLHGAPLLFASTTCDPAQSYLRGVQLAIGRDPCLLDMFLYRDGLLAGNLNEDLTWTATAGKIYVASGMVKIDFDDPEAGYSETQTQLMGLSCGPCDDGTITVRVRVKALSANTGGNDWSLWYYDENGRPFGRWYGGPPSARPRIAGRVLNPVNLTLDAWDELKVVIDTLNNQTDYYHNGNFLGSLPHGGDANAGWEDITDALGGIGFSDWSRPDSEGPFQGALYFDDLEVMSCPDTTCYASVSPQGAPLPYALSGGAAADPPSDEFTVSNDGLEALSYTVSESTATGGAAEYPWFTLSPSGGPIDPTVPVTATYDTTGLEPGMHLGYVKFVDNCNPDISHIRSIKLNVDECMTETFDDYSDGNLETKPGWYSTMAGGGGTTMPIPIQVSGGVVKLIGGDGAAGTVNALHDRDNCPDCPVNGLHAVTYKIRGHTGGSHFWRIHVTDVAGNDLAAWYGMGGSIRHGVAGFWSEPLPLTGGETWDEIEARINPHDVPVEGVAANSTQFLMNGVTLQTLDHTPAGDRVRRVEIRRIANDTTQDTDPVVEIDDLVVSRCRPLCNDPFADAEGNGEIGKHKGDGDVDQNDFAVFQLCYTGQGGTISDDEPYCRCFDRGADSPGDGDIDAFDYDAFKPCASGPGVPANTACDD